MDIGTEDGLPDPVAYTDIAQRGTAGAFHHGAVGMVERRDAHRRRGGHRGVGDGVWVRGRLHVDVAVGPPVLRVGLALPVLDAPVDVEYGLIPPAFVVGFRGEEVPVVPVPA